MCGWLLGEHKSRTVRRPAAASAAGGQTNSSSLTSTVIFQAKPYLVLGLHVLAYAAINARHLPHVQVWLARHLQDALLETHIAHPGGEMTGNSIIIFFNTKYTFRRKKHPLRAKLVVQDWRTFYLAHIRYADMARTTTTLTHGTEDVPRMYHVYMSPPSQKSEGIWRKDYKMVRIRNTVTNQRMLAL